MLYNNKFFRFINQNRNLIIFIIIICAFIVFLIRSLNGILGNSNKSEENTIETDNTSKVIEDSKKSVISNTTLDTETATNNYNIIDNFVDLCNKNNINEAYNLLSEECKKNLYPNVDTFEENYVNVVFKNKITIDVKNWMKNSNFTTYLVTYAGDMLSTGNVDSKKFQDYITIDTNEQKLNINKYIGRINKNDETEVENIKFTVNYVDIYKDYEIYNIKIENKNNNEIILDNLNSVSSTYIETSEDTQINCSNFEAGKISFQYRPGMAKEINLKFIKQYNPEINDKNIVFSSAILDTNNMENTQKIKIEL